MDINEEKGMKEKCPECGSLDIKKDSQLGEAMCRSCGLIIEDTMPCLSAYREGTSTIKPLFKDGRIVKAPWLLSAKEKNLQKSRKQLDLVAERLKLPDYIKEQSLQLYEQAVNRNLCVGRNKESILCACIYYICNQNSIPKTAMEITEYLDINEHMLFKTYSLLQKELGLRSVLVDPVDLLPRFISNLGLSNDCLIRAITLMNQIKGTPAYSGKNPKSILAAVIYISAKGCGEQIAQREVANQIGVTETTIRKRCKGIKNKSI